MLVYSENSIVIVGAGSIGLASAYHLAKLSRAHHSQSQSIRPPRIVVVDAFDQPFAAASSTCTGCFHYGFSYDNELLRLGKYSFDLWAATAASEPEFRAATGYRAQSSFGIEPGTGQRLDVLPNWVQRDPAWDVDANVLGPKTATV